MPTCSLRVNATSDELFALVSDYQLSVDWMPDVVAATVLANEGDIAVVEFLSPFLMDGKYVLEFLHSRPRSIAYKQVDQYGSRGLRGSWRFEAAREGGTMVTGEMDYRTTIWNYPSARRRTQLILQRRLDSLAASLPGEAGRRDVEAAASQLPIGALTAGEAATVWTPLGRYVVTRADE